MYIRIVNLKFASEIESDAMQAFAEHELINKIPKIPVRFGMTFGGKDRLRFGLGSGYSFGKVKVDVAFGYIGSFKMANTRGLDLGLNVFYDYKKSDEANSTFIDKIKKYLVSFFSKKDKIELEMTE